MGFYKRFITQDGIIDNIQDLDNYLKADALIFDTWSSKFFEDLDNDERILRNKIKKELQTTSGCPSSQKDYDKLNSLSETLISLKTDPSWLDIHFTKVKLGLQFTINGEFEEQVEKCINEIIDYYFI